MRGLALATLFLGVCLLHPEDAAEQMVLSVLRIFIFVIATALIGLGA
jgi:hypothetical protein